MIRAGRNQGSFRWGMCNTQLLAAVLPTSVGYSAVVMVITVAMGSSLVRVRSGSPTFQYYLEQITSAPKCRPRPFPRDFMVGVQAVTDHRSSRWSAFIASVILATIVHASVVGWRSYNELVICPGSFFPSAFHHFSLFSSLRKLVFFLILCS